MTGLERRQSPRTKVDGFAYLNLGTANGGSLVDVSEGGLGFRAIAPVQRNGPINVRFSERNLRIEADSELAWTDATHKTGGLRFKALPPASREQIRQWINQAIPVAVSEGSATSALRAFPAVHSLPNAVAVQSTPPVAVSPEIKPLAPLRGFSGGLVTGLMVSVLVAAVFLFQTYRRQVGESLIRLGEQFGASPQTQAQVDSSAAPTIPPSPQTMLSAPQTVLQVSRAVTQPPAAVPQPEKISPDVVKKAAETLPTRVPPLETATAKPAAPSGTSGAATVKAPAAPPLVPAAVPPAAVNVPVNLAMTSPAPAASLPVSSPPTSTPAGSSLSPNKTSPAPIPPMSASSTQAVQTPTLSTPSVSEMFFEVGKFKDDAEAQSTKDRLAQLGFPATAVQKGRLWMNSYHVLVGPYDADSEAKAARKKLSSRGFVPRAFRRGSRSLTVLSGLTLDGASMPAGDYTISWESYVTDASVKVVRDNQVVATTDGKWVKHGIRYPHDAYMYRRNGDGSQTLIEIRFAGMDQALVFGKS